MVPDSKRPQRRRGEGELSSWICALLEEVRSQFLKQNGGGGNYQDLRSLAPSLGPVVFTPITTKLREDFDGVMI